MCEIPVTAGKGLIGFQEQPEMERPVRCLQQWVPSGNRSLGSSVGWEAAGQRGFLRTWLSLLFPGSQGLVFWECPLRKGLLDPRNTKENIQGSDKSRRKEFLMTPPQPAS